jgi:ligand-binding sensor domain-containing protein
MKAILLFLILIFVCSNVSAQEVKIFNDINKTSIVNNNKLTIDKSNDNIWISTNNGIKIWNGSTFIKYTTLNSGLPSNKINCIFIEGVNKWIGTDSGLTKFDGNTWTNYNSNIHPQLNNVYSITKDNSGL